MILIRISPNTNNIFKKIYSFINFSYVISIVIY